MNEFDKIPSAEQPADNNSSSNEVNASPENPAQSSPASETPSPSDPSWNNENAYSFKGDQLSDSTTRINQPASDWSSSYGSYGTSSSYGEPAHSEYEVSFDSASGRYTYTDRSAYSQQPTEKPPKKPRRGLLALGLCATVLVSALLGIGGGAATAVYLIRNSDEIDGSNNHSSVQQSTVVQVNDGDVNYGAIADATAKCYDSVVVIETYLSDSFAEAGEASGAGSGVIWTEDGYIVTCNHVVDDANVIRVILTDGSSYYADVVGTDSETDLAVLKIQASGLRAVNARGSSLVLGETAIAIGNPLGVLANSVSEGILSCLAREITVEGQTMSLLQTTAAVNSGNSGGGLFDINGSLIGIVNAKSTGESVEGLGFAIPIETVLDVSTQLIEQGFVSGRPQLGISVITVTQANAASIFSDPEYAALQEYATKTVRGWGRDYTEIVPGTYILDASAVVGYADGSDSLKYGDMILYVGNTEVETTVDVKAALNGYRAGDTIQITVLRGQSQTIIINLILGQLGST